MTELNCDMGIVGQFIVDDICSKINRINIQNKFEKKIEYDYKDKTIITNLYRGTSDDKIITEIFIFILENSYSEGYQPYIIFNNSNMCIIEFKQILSKYKSSLEKDIVSKDYPKETGYCCKTK